MYCVGFSYNGSIPKTLTRIQKDILINSIDMIHNLGVVHNDIKIENILVDEAGVPFIIDFGFSEKNASKQKQEEEREIFLECIEGY